MANLTPTPGWDDVPQLETTTLALGGASGPMNYQAKALLNRTEFLAAQITGLSNFMPDGFNAVSRSIAGKLREWVSPLDVGAIGNGTTPDDTKLANAASDNPGRLFNGAGKTYAITANLPAGWRMIEGHIVDSRTVNYTDQYSVVGIGRNTLKANTFIPEQHVSSYPYPTTYWASGNHLVAIGGDALASNTTGRRNTAVGSRCMVASTAGYYNTGVGSHSLERLTTGNQNVAVGVQALNAVTSAEGNTGVGTTAGTNITTGENNTAVGYLSMTYATTANRTTAVGYRAAFSVTSADDTVAIGRDALVALTTGTQNTALGANAGGTAVTVTNMLAAGWNALRLSTGDNNTGLGALAFFSATSGGENTGVGAGVGFSMTSGYRNTFAGRYAGQGVTSGYQNAVFGAFAGGTLDTGFGNTLLGYATDTIAAAQNTTSVGNGATCTGNNQVTLGNSSVSALRCQVTTITALSDERDKKDIQPLHPLLPKSFISEVRAVAYRWAMRDGTDRGDALQAGVIAQDLKRLQDKYDLQWLRLVDETNPDRLEATPGNLLLPLLVEVQRQDERLAALEADMAKLMAKLG